MKKIEQLEEKYIELLLKKGVGAKDIDSLLIQIELKEQLPFAEKIREQARNFGVNDVEIAVFDSYELHDALQNTDVENISLDNPQIRNLIDKSKWNEYAKKQGGILFVASAVPGLMNDIEPEKINKRVIEGLKTNEYYRQNMDNGSFTWSIAAYPNQKWAEQVFPNDKKAYEKLYMRIIEACMCDKDNPLQAWDDYLIQANAIAETLNSLEIINLHYKNSLGTNLYIEMPKNHIWKGIGIKNLKGNIILQNIPSYEIFSSPDYRKTTGIVYSSKPLVFLDQLIEDFYLYFENGKVIDFGAKKGEAVLKEILNVDNESNIGIDRLGEVAFVEYDSPISKTGLIYYTTLFDENASCHLALGNSFESAIQGGNNMTEKQLLESGLNQANNHIDFMIGTEDLSVIAQTTHGEIPIIEDGNFSKTLTKRIKK